MNMPVSMFPTDNGHLPKHSGKRHTIKTIFRYALKIGTLYNIYFFEFYYPFKMNTGIGMWFSGGVCDWHVQGPGFTLNIHTYTHTNPL